MAWSRQPRKLASEALWDYALGALGRRAHSAAELKQKLALRAANPAALHEVLQRLREYGFTDDGKFSETYANSRLQNEGFGAMRVLRELRAKRVAAPIAEQAVRRTFENTDEDQLIDQFMQRKYRSKNLSEFLQDDRNLASAFRRLRTAGFSGSAALRALKRLGSRTTDLEEPPEEEEDV